MDVVTEYTLNRSSNTVAAASKETPYFATFALALSSSYSNSIIFL